MSAETFCNLDAERNVLAFIATNKSNREILTALTGGEFFTEQCKQIFTVMQWLAAEKKPIDMVTTATALTERYGDNGDILANYLMDCITKKICNTEWQARHYCEIIKSTAMRRRIFEIVDKAKNDLLDDTNDAATVLDSTRQTLRDIVVTKHAWESMNDVMLTTFETIEKKSKGEDPSMPSGIATLDKITTGFHKGELTILGARPAVGKSALGAHIALSTAAKGYKIGICSREMTAAQYGARVLARATDVDNAKIRSGNLDENEWAQLSDAMVEYSNMNISFMFSTRYIEDLRMEVQKKVDSGDLDLLVVDYVQLMQTKQKFDKDYMRIAYVSKMLKDMTIDYNIAILALAQVGRSSEGTMPTLAELRGSGDLEQDADNVMFMHRPKDADDKYVNPEDKQMFFNLKSKGMQYMAINIAKQRQGETGTVAVVFNPARMQFTAISRREDG